MPLPEISVIIPSKNGLPHLKECLPSLLAAAESYPSRIEIIVVDDHSDDETLSFLSHHFPKIKTVVNSGQGISSGRNCGVALSSSPWLCFLDNDVFVEKDFFTNLGAKAGLLYLGLFQELMALDNKKIYFLARDGYNLYHLFNTSSRASQKAT